MEPTYSQPIKQKKYGKSIFDYEGHDLWHTRYNFFNHSQIYYFYVFECSKTVVLNLLMLANHKTEKLACSYSK